jgi:hypothetical protein
MADIYLRKEKKNQKENSLPRHSPAGKAFTGAADSTKSLNSFCSAE